MDKYTPDLYKKGISVITTNYQRALPEVKSMNYLPCILALKQAKKKKVFEALLIDNNCKITEGTFSNLFIVRNDTLITAKDNILNGITRNIVLKLAKPVFKKIILKNLMKTEIYKAEEAFLAVTTGEIIPITKIDGHKIKLGKYTKLLMAKYKEYIKGK
jgi:branched-chain amino acid aminotransferase